jgi:protein transport protein SEC23
MKSLTNATNGFMVISDSFTTAIFKQSFLRTLGKDEDGFLQMGFNGTFDVIVCVRYRVEYFQVSVDKVSALFK